MQAWSMGSIPLRAKVVHSSSINGIPRIRRKWKIERTFAIQSSLFVPSPPWTRGKLFSIIFFHALVSRCPFLSLFHFSSFVLSSSPNHPHGQNEIPAILCSYWEENIRDKLAPKFETYVIDFCFVGLPDESVLALSFPLSFLFIICRESGLWIKLWWLNWIPFYFQLMALSSPGTKSEIYSKMVPSRTLLHSLLFSSSSFIIFTPSSLLVSSCLFVTVRYRLLKRAIRNVKSQLSVDWRDVVEKESKVVLRERQGQGK